MLLAVWLFARATQYNRTLLLVITGWITFQSVLGLAVLGQDFGLDAFSIIQAMF